MRATSHRYYLLALLTTVLVFNYVDRLTLGLVLQNIKLDLHLTDTQLGFLSGIAFALFYSVMGIPIARWADRGNRILIIALSVAMWSVAVAACALATTFTQLLLIRVFVAVGEAGCLAPSFSLLADYFDRAERPRAAAIYGLGAPLSALIGYLLAGQLNELYGWKITFALLAAPGFALAALVWFTLSEPRHAKSLGVRLSAAASDLQSNASVSTAQPSLLEVGQTLWAIGTFRHLLLCMSVMYFFDYGILQWQPTFFIRSYGLTSGEVGLWLAAILGLGGGIGTYLGGELSARYTANNERLQLLMVAGGIATCGVLSASVYLTHNLYLAVALMGFGILTEATVNGPVVANIQTLVPERMRAVSFAIVFLFANLIGMGLGPLAAGALSDALHAWAGEESLRYALLILAPGYLWGAWHAWRASKAVAGDLAARHRMSGYASDDSAPCSMTTYA